MPGLWGRFGFGTAWGIPVPSKVLVFILPQTFMSVYYYDNSSLVEGLPGCEGRNTWKRITRTLWCKENYGPVCQVCERSFGLVRPGVCPYHPKFWYIFSPRPVWLYIIMIIVVWLRGCLGMRVETLEKGLSGHYGAKNITGPYVRFVREVLGWYSLGYACTIQSIGIYSPQDLYECILL